MTKSIKECYDIIHTQDIIERNAAMALRAYDCALFGKHIGKFRKNRVSFDNVVTVMKEAGDMLNTELKETSIGGLAKNYRESAGNLGLLHDM